MHQLHAGDRVRIRDERWQVARVAPYGATAVVDVRGCDLSNRGENARFLLPYEAVDPLPRWPAAKVVRPARWRHVARQALADASASWTSLRAAARAAFDILPFQLEPALALVRGDGCRFLIADAVGMGKTIQAGLMVAESLQRHPDGRVLIVTPAGLRDQWHGELRDRFGLHAAILDASGVARAQANLPADVNPWSVHPLAITSIDYVKRPEVIRCLEPLLWDVLVFDESHGLSGRSDRASAADALGRRARTVVMLTATPHSGDEDAFHRLCTIGQLKNDGPLLLFRRTRSDIGMAGSRRTMMLRVRPTPAEAAMHAALLEYARLVWSQPASAAFAGARLAMSVLMRRASSSAASLARSLDRRLTLLGTPLESQAVQASLPFAAEGDDAEPDAVLGASGLYDSHDERARLEHVLALARDASGAESKLTALRRLLRRARQPAIVFTEYRDTLQQVADVLAIGDAVRLHGGLIQRERADALRAFIGGAAPLLLATDAASEGLNLHQRCRLVINLELPWTPLRLEQRIGRIDRIGQRRRVHAVHMVASGTSEEHVLATLAERMSRMDAAMASLAPGRSGVEGPLPDERAVAECVLADRVLPDVTPPSQPSPLKGVCVPDLAHQASVEAARIVTARRLIERSDGNPDTRPVLTRMRTARYRQHEAQCYWMFRVLLAAADGRIISTACVPLRAAGTPGLPRSHRSTRLLLDPRLPVIQQIATAASSALADAATRADGVQLRVQQDRERALMDELRNRHARLSAGLLQPGLFDRRSERAAAAQASLLQQALSASATRMAQLMAAEALQVESCELVFAVALE